MCDPMTMAIGQFVIGAAQSVVGYMGQQAEYQKQEEYRAENTRLANENAKRQYNDVGMRMMQEEEAAAIAKQEASRDARAARARASAAAGEGGVTGLSVDALLKDFYGREGTYRDRLNQQTDWTNQQLRNEMHGIKATATDRAHSVRPATPPSFWDAGLRIMGSGLDAFGSYRRMTAPATGY